MTGRLRVWIQAEGEDRPPLQNAVLEGGAALADSSTDADAVVWADYGRERIVRHLHERVRWVQVWDAGVDEWISLGAIDRARQWTCAKGIYAGPIAEYCLAALLAAARDLPAVHRARGWWRPEPSLLAGMTVTVLGAGGIGGALIRILEPFQTRAIAVTRSANTVPGAASSVGPDRLDDVLPETDALIVALPLTGATRRLVDGRRLALLRQGAWVVNVGRGEVLETTALVERLTDGSLGGAVLDVTDPEPLADGHPLWALDNVIVTSHTAATATLGRSAFASRVQQNVARFIAGTPLIGTVDADAGY